MMNNTWLKPRYVLMALMAVTLAFHSINLSTASYELDEAVHVWFAQMSYADVVEQASNDPNPPIYNLIISTWVKVFGVSEFSTRFFSVLMGMFGVGLMFLVAQRNFGMTVGILAALFLCFSPIQFRFTHLARPYSMLMVTVILSYGLLLECILHPSRRKLALSYLATTLMIYVHPTSIFNVAAQGLIILLHQWKNLKAILRLALPLVGAVASFGIWVLAIPYFERDDAMWFSAPDLNAVYYVIKVFYGSIELVVLQLVLLVILLIQAIKKGWSPAGSNIFSVLIWLVVPFCISIGFSHLIKPIFQDKYILSVQPAAMLFLAVSISQIRINVLKWVACASAIGLLFSLISIKPKAEDDWKSAVEYVKPKLDENSMILIDPWYEYRTFAFYFDREAYENPDSTLHFLYSNRVSTDWNSVFDVSTSRPKTDVVHLMLAHQGYVTPLVPTELIDSLAVLIGLKEFPGVTVKTYSFTASLDTVFRETVYEKVGFSLIESQQEFSETIVVPLEIADQSGALKVTSSVNLRSGQDLQDVFMIMSVEKEGQSVVYKRLNLADQKLPDGEEVMLVKDVLTLSEFEKDWVVKVYVWNVARKRVELSTLTVTVEN